MWLIPFTEHKGKNTFDVVYINPETVVSVRKKEAFTQISLINGEAFNVQEQIEMVRDLLTNN